MLFPHQLQGSRQRRDEAIGVARGISGHVWNRVVGSTHTPTGGAGPFPGARFLADGDRIRFKADRGKRQAPFVGFRFSGRGWLSFLDRDRGPHRDFQRLRGTRPERVAEKRRILFFLLAATGVAAIGRIAIGPRRLFEAVVVIVGLSPAFECLGIDGWFCAFEGLGGRRGGRG